MFRKVVRSAFETLATNPAILKRSLPSMTSFLQPHTGAVNRPTDQEASFADVVTEHGFRFMPKTARVPPSDGLYYIYQLYGSQSESDFSLREYEDGDVKAEVVVDLKHTRGKSFYLNDGWFQDDTVYMVSWNEGTQKAPLLRTHIALGQDIPSAEERALMKKLQAFKRIKNISTKNVESLRPYIRFANQYSCERFTQQTAATHLASTLAWV
jgi:hypothetical protein